MTCRVSTKYHIGYIDMSPKVKMCNEFKEFLSLRCLSPTKSSMGYWEKIGNKKSEQNQSSKEINRANANEQI